MVQILKEKPCLFVKRPADIGRQVTESLQRRIGVRNSYRAGLGPRFADRNALMFASIEAAISSALSNGPWTRPSSMSRSARANRAASARFSA
jgi:hypothetical protein